MDADSAGERLRFDIGGRSVAVRPGGTGTVVGRRGGGSAYDASAVSPAETRTVLWKRSPDGRFVLRRIGVEGAALSGSAGEVEFRIDAGGVCEIDMTNVAWADWGQGGCLLVATRDGRLRVEKISAAGRVLVNEHDVRDLEPAAGGAPAWAQRG